MRVRARVRVRWRVCAREREAVCAGATDRGDEREVGLEHLVAHDVERVGQHRARERGDAALDRRARERVRALVKPAEQPQAGQRALHRVLHEHRRAVPRGSASIVRRDA